MKKTELRGKAAIIGYGDCHVRHKDIVNRKNPLQLTVEAVKTALQTSGIAKSQIQGLLTPRSPVADQRQQWNNILASYLKITPILSTQVTIHGAGTTDVLRYATMAIQCGLADYVLCAFGDSTQFGNLFGFTPTLDSDPEFEYPFGPTMPALYAMWATRYMNEFGVRESDLARIAVAHQAWAVHHPYASKGPKGLITVDQVLSSPYIAKPLRLWDCAVRGPGGSGGAFVVTSAERARDHTDKPLYILGFGELSTHEYLTDRMALRDSGYDLGPLPNLTHTGAREASRNAYEMAGLSPRDMSVVAGFGNFTISVLLSLEDLGFCKKGDAAGFVNDGHIDPGGDLPFNTDGGRLSFGQPGIAAGMNSVIEIIRQLRGEAMGIQVPNARFGLIHGGGGTLACHSVAILGTEIPS